MEGISKFFSNVGVYFMFAYIFKVSIDFYNRFNFEIIN